MKITSYNQHCSAPFPEPWSFNSCQVYSVEGADAVIQSAVDKASYMSRCSSEASLRGLVGDVVGCADGENALVATDEERPFEEPGALVVQEIFVPAIFDQLGNDDDDAPVGMVLGEF